MLLFPDRNFRVPTQYNSASPDVDTSSLVKTVRKHSGESTESSDNNISIGDTQNGTKSKRRKRNQRMRGRILWSKSNLISRQRKLTVETSKRPQVQPELRSPMMEFLWKRTSLLSLRLIWKTSLQMLSRLFPLTASCREKHKKPAF